MRLSAAEQEEMFLPGITGRRDIHFVADLGRTAV